jgi:hypothetical protein
MLRRFLERRSIFAPDRSHLHHRLLDMGLQQRHVVVLIYLITGVITGLGMFMMATRNAGTLIIFGCGLFSILLVFRLFGAVRLRDTLSHLQRKRSLSLQVREHQTDFETAQLQFRQVSSFEAWWQAVQGAAETMECVWMALRMQNRSGRKETKLWQRRGPQTEPDKLLEFTLPVRQRRTAAADEAGVRLTVAVQINGSLEAAGNRVALFSRLIDEHSLQELPYVVPDPPSRPETVKRAETANIQEIFTPAGRSYSPVS